MSLIDLGELMSKMVISANIAVQNDIHILLFVMQEHEARKQTASNLFQKYKKSLQAKEWDPLAFNLQVF